MGYGWFFVIFYLSIGLIMVRVFAKKNYEIGNCVSLFIIISWLPMLVGFFIQWLGEEKPKTSKIPQQENLGKKLEMQQMIIASVFRCGVCNKYIQEEKIFFCKECQAPFHKDCLNYYKKCYRYGCKSESFKKRALTKTNVA